MLTRGFETLTTTGATGLLASVVTFGATLGETFGATLGVTLGVVVEAESLVVATTDCRTTVAVVVVVGVSVFAD
jgi:hypothetical protein